MVQRNSDQSRKPDVQQAEVEENEYESEEESESAPSDDENLPEF
jgi:hypothetical protein